jgi:hypothetical protein
MFVRVAGGPDGVNEGAELLPTHRVSCSSAGAETQTSIHPGRAIGTITGTISGARWWRNW